MRRWGTGATDGRRRGSTRRSEALEHTPGAKAPCSLDGLKAKPEGLAYLEAPTLRAGPEGLAYQEATTTTEILSCAQNDELQNDELKV